MNQLTAGKTNTLRVDLTDNDAVNCNAVYQTFALDTDANGFAVSFTGYTGDCGQLFPLFITDAMYKYGNLNKNWSVRANPNHQYLMQKLFNGMTVFCKLYTGLRYSVSLNSFTN